MSISFDQRLIRPSEVLFQELDGESVVLHLTQGEYFGLNETGQRMWVILTESPSIQHAYEQLLSEFEVDPAELKQDLRQLIDDLVEHGLVQVAA